MMLIGLTGSMASGKSTVAAMLQNAHIPVIDADELARNACLPSSLSYQKIVEEFGTTILKADGTIERSALSAIVFNNPDALNSLEAILHPAIHQLYLEKIEELKAKNTPVVVYMAPLLFEKGLEKLFHKTILVIADDKLLEQRAALRDQLDKDEIRKRLKRQMNTANKIKKADAVIDNNGTKEELYKNLQKIWHQITNTNLTI